MPLPFSISVYCTALRLPYKGINCFLLNFNLFLFVATVKKDFLSRYPKFKAIKAIVSLLIPSWKIFLMESNYLNADIQAGAFILNT